MNKKQINFLSFLKMVYAKKRNYRRKYRRNNTTLAKKAYYLAKKAQAQKELKWYEESIVDSTPDTTGSVQEIFNPAVGSTNNSREGNVVYPTSLKIRSVLTMHASATATRVRVLVYSFKCGTSTALTDVLTGSSINAFKSDDNRYNSSIIYDRTIQLNVNSPERQLNLTLRKKISKFISFADGAATSKSHGLFMILLSDESTNVPSYSGNIRTYFKDS